MGNGMNKVLPGLFVGNYRDSKDQTQLQRNQITHILAIHDSPRRLLADKHYLCVMAADTPDQNLQQYFSVCNDFIHSARLREGNVLIHCLAGMSRSVTVAVAYIMTVTNLSWRDALKVVRAGRAVANPNIGFQNQLQEFETHRLAEERRRLRERFPSTALEKLDRNKCMSALSDYAELLQNRDICEGNCTRGEKCPTGERTIVHGEAGDAIDKYNSGSGGSANPKCGCIYTESGCAFMITFTEEELKNLRKRSVSPYTRAIKRAAAQKAAVAAAAERNNDDSGCEKLMQNVRLYKPKSDANAEHSWRLVHATSTCSLDSRDYVSEAC